MMTAWELFSQFAISRLCDPVIVMAEGSVLFEGTSEEVKKNEKVIESYLGRGSKVKGDNN